MMNNNKKVAHLIREYVRPTETFVINQINTLKNNNSFEPIVFCQKRITNSNNDIKTIVINEKFTRFGKIFSNTLYNYFRIPSPKAINKIIDALNDQQVKILHLHYLVDARFFIQVMKKSNLPSIISVYGYDVASFPKSIWGIGKKYITPIFKEADCFLAMSDDMKKDLLAIGCPESKIIVHYHGINVSRFKYYDRKFENSKTLKILFCGQLIYKKAPILLLEALEIILKRNLTDVPFELNFVGDGPLRQEIENRIKRHGLQNKVKLLGHIPHESKLLIDEYRKADIFVLPSMVIRNNKEGIPGTLIEAMASGLPIISSIHAGIPEIVTSGKNGLLIKEGDLEDLASKLSYLINSNNVRQKLGMAALNSTENLSLEVKTKQLEEIYNKFL